MAGSSLVPKLLSQSYSEDAGDESWAGLLTSSGAQPVSAGDVSEAVPALESDTPWMLQLFFPAAILRINFNILSYSFK